MAATITRPANTSSTLLAIETSWEAMASQPKARRFTTLGDIALSDLHEVFLDSKTSRGWKNEVLLELLFAAGSGDELALHTIVRLFIPKAVKLSHSCSALRGMRSEDALSVAISAIWEAARRVPMKQWDNPAANLYLNAMKIIATETRGNAELAVDDEYLLWRVDEAAKSAPAADTPEHELVELFAWALDSSTLTRDEVALMVRYYLCDGPRDEVQASRDALAADLGISRVVLQKRASRLSLKLTAAVKAHISENGRW